MEKRPVELTDALENMSAISESIEPLTYVEDLGDRFLVSMDMPLVEKKDLEITVSDQHLEISARMCRKISSRGAGTFAESYHSAAFHKCVSLPGGIDLDAARAVFEKGILEITLPKKAGKKKIAVK